MSKDFAVKRSNAKVVVLIPLPVDPEEEPINENIIMINTVAICSSANGTDRNPVLRIEVALKKALMIDSTTPWFASVL